LTQHNQALKVRKQSIKSELIGKQLKSRQVLPETTAGFFIPPSLCAFLRICGKNKFNTGNTNI
jgi:hypothetical protein